MDRTNVAHGGRFSRRIAVTAVVAAAALILAGGLLIYGWVSSRDAEAAGSRLRLQDIPFNGTRAYEDLKKICALGPRPSNSAGMKAQQQMLTEHFTKLGAKVRRQEFQARHPVDGSAVPMANLIVQWHPESKQRILLCTHYDTLPLPMRDPVNPRGTFVGANDGGSGTALFMELGREMPQLEPGYGVDFVFFDGEEYISREDDKYFWGSEHFAEDYVKDPPPYRYRWAVLLDMIGDADLQIYHERNSVWWRDTKPLVDKIWGTARRLGVREFIPQKKWEVRDDHLALHNIAGIPACDVIDFDYPAWHTQADTPERCSALSLAKVGWVIREWMVTAK